MAQDCKAREAAQQERSRAHAGEPGSASSSQAQVTPPASGRMAETAGARAAGIAASDVKNMKKADLRTLAISLGVTTRANRKNVDALRAACARVLQGQRGIMAYLQPAVASQGDCGAGQVGGVAAPVSDSAYVVEPCQTSAHKRSRTLVKSRWLRKTFDRTGSQHGKKLDRTGSHHGKKFGRTGSHHGKKFDRTGSHHGKKFDITGSHHGKKFD